MKFSLLLPCTAALVGLHGAHAQTVRPLPAEVAIFLSSPIHCAVLTGGLDHANDGADRVYGESLSKALMALSGPVSAAIDWVRNACASRLAPSASLKETS